MTTDKHHLTPSTPADGRTGQSDREFLESAIVHVSDILAGCWDDRVDEPMSVRDAFAYGTVEDQVAAMDHALLSDPRWARRHRD